MEAADTGRMEAADIRRIEAVEAKRTEPTAACPFEKAYSLGLYEKSMPDCVGLAEKLRYASDAGYDFLELSIDETDEKLARLDWGIADTQAILRDQAKTGLPIRSFCLSGLRRYPLGHPDPAVRGKSLEIMFKAIRLAAGLGARIIQIAGYDVYYQEPSGLTRECFSESLFMSVEYAAKHGVVLAFETMETEFLNTVEKAMYWVGIVDSPYLQVYPDTGNITNAAAAYGSDAVSDLKTGRGHIVALHLKESKPNVFREVPYGEGHVDFTRLAGAAMSLGVRRFLAEFWHPGDGGWLAALGQNNRFLRNAIEANLTKANHRHFNQGSLD